MSSTSGPRVIGTLLLRASALGVAGVRLRSPVCDAPGSADGPRPPFVSGTRKRGPLLEPAPVEEGLSGGRCGTTTEAEDPAADALRRISAMGGDAFPDIPRRSALHSRIPRWILDVL